MTRTFTEEFRMQPNSPWRFYDADTATYFPEECTRLVQHWEGMDEITKSEHILNETGLFDDYLFAKNYLEDLIRATNKINQFNKHLEVQIAGQNISS